MNNKLEAADFENITLNEKQKINKIILEKAKIIGKSKILESLEDIKDIDNFYDLIKIIVKRLSYGEIIKDNFSPILEELVKTINSDEEIKKAVKFFISKEGAAYRINQAGADILDNDLAEKIENWDKE